MTVHIGLADRQLGIELLDPGAEVFALCVRLIRSTGRIPHDEA